VPYFFTGRLVFIEDQPYLMGTGIDISDRVRAEKTLLDQTRELERSNKDLERFAFIASHDLQEPLRKIQSFGDRLDEKYHQSLDEKGKHYLMRMRESARRSQEMVDDLLIYSKISRSQKEFGYVNLNLVLEEVLDNLQTTIELSNAKIETDSLPFLYSNRSQMYQLFQHLIDNGIKFSHDGRDPEIEIRVGNHQDDLVTLSFTDNGIGLDPKYTHKVFQPFQRLHGRDKFPGSGIGLAICSRIVEQHHGSIDVESTPGAGTTIIVTIPNRKVYNL
jgi:light-regulated signal transduction histidine kinase (bacteriophytochrome)